MAVKIDRNPSPPKGVRILTSSREMSSVIVIERVTEAPRVLVNSWDVHGGSQKLVVTATFALSEMREWCEAIIEMIDATPVAP